MMARSLLAIGSNMPGYLPNDPESVVVLHWDDDSDLASALGILFDEMLRDGENSWEGAEYDGDDENSVRDHDQLLPIESGVRERAGELWEAMLTELRTLGETGRIIDWSAGSLSYWIQPAVDDVCSDEDCDICGEDEDD